MIWKRDLQNHGEAVSESNNAWFRLTNLLILSPL